MQDKQYILIITDQEGTSAKSMVEEEIRKIQSKDPSAKITRHDGGDVMDKGRQNAETLRDTNSNVATVCLGNRDLNLIKRNKILHDNLEKLLQPEIIFYNTSAKFNKSSGQLSPDYLKLTGYSRPSHLMWNQGDLLLNFLQEQGLLAWNSDGTVSLNIASLSKEDEELFRMEFLQWDCTHNQGAPNFVSNLIQELDADNANEAQTSVFAKVSAFFVKEVKDLLKKARFAYLATVGGYPANNLVLTHSTISPQVLNIPESLIELIKAKNELFLDQVLEQNYETRKKDYVNLFGETTKVYRVDNLSQVIQIHNRAWELYLKAKDEESNSSDELINKAEQSFIEFGLPNNPQGFSSASQINRGSERRCAAELSAMQKMMVPTNQNLMINIVGHKPTDFYSVAHQEINGVNLYTVRADLSMSGQGVVVLKEENEFIIIECVQNIRNIHDKITTQEKNKVFDQDQEIRTKYTIDKYTGKLVSSMQAINENEFIEVPLTERYRENDGDGREWRVAMVIPNPNEPSEVNYLLTCPNGDYLYQDEKGNVVKPFDKQYRLISQNVFYSNYVNVNDYMRDSSGLNVNPHNYNSFFANKNNKEKLDVASVITLCACTGLVAAVVGAGLIAAAPLLANLPFIWHFGVTLVGLGISVMLVGATIKLMTDCFSTQEQTSSLSV